MTTVEFDLPTIKLFDGQQYSVSQNTDLSGGGMTSMLIENPPDSGVEVYVFLTRITHEVETNVAVYTDVTDISGGSTEEINGDNVGGSEDTSVTAKTDATYTTVNEHFRIVYTSFGEHDLLGGTAMIVESGHNMVVELTNQGSSNSQVGIRMAWVEKPD